MTSKLQKNTVILSVTFHKVSNSRTGSLEGIDVDADKNSLRLSKEFIRSEDFKKLTTIGVEVKKMLEVCAVPTKVFKRGTYLLPVAMLEEVYPVLEKAKIEYEAAASRVADEWEEIIVDAQLRLRTQFDPKNYPSAEVMRGKFWMDWGLMELSVPGSGIIGNELYEKEKEKAKNVWEEAEREVTEALREGMQKMVGRMVNQLGMKPDGSKARLQPAAVRDIQEFLNMFGKRNVLCDTELAEMVEQAKKLLDGKDAKDVRNDAEYLKTELTKVAEGLDKLVTSSKRSFNFDED